MEGCSGLRLFQARRPTILAVAHPRPQPRRRRNLRPARSHYVFAERLTPRPLGDFGMKLNPRQSRILGRVEEVHLTLDADATPILSNDSAATSGTEPARIQRSPFHNVFVGPKGIRAGWRLLIFLVLFISIASGIGFGVRHV